MDILYEIGDFVFDNTEGRPGIVKDFTEIDYDPDFPTAYSGVEYTIEYPDGETGRANQEDVFSIRICEQSTEIVYSIEIEELDFDTRLTYTDGEVPYGTDVWDFDDEEDEDEDEKILTEEMKEAIQEQCSD